ncbi:4-hydroxythreonine-4-phosphate dehydrogenase PdxA [Candidatus Desantisbacteria bacterium]|nr:4-hydroxythreonine-4-phosphate dehydrogenase PdxA [Candidatus Desantisbacteria bacterium]
MSKPVIAITMGDPGGVGPEIICKALTCFSYSDENYIPLVIGDAGVLKHRMEMFNIKGSINIIDTLSNITEKSGYINCLNLNNILLDKLKIGTIQKMSGKASIEYIYKAFEYLKKETFHAMVTCPINKESINKAGFLYAGHTELLAKLTKTKKFAMMLAGEKLKVVLVTTHIAINKVSLNITQEKIQEKIKLTFDFLNKKFVIKSPKIAVCGLNPHSGEGGLFGNEERTKIIPAILNMQKKNIDVSGPYPADTLFYTAQHGTYDAVIVMYHDQGLIPLKMLYMDTGVNLTLGLPIIRTSVDHGTAFDIAQKGTASCSSLNSAIKLAAYLVNK